VTGASRALSGRSSEAAEPSQARRGTGPDTARPSRRPKLACLLNALAPDRASLLAAVSDRFDLMVLYSGPESNRSYWSPPDRDAGFRIKRSSGITVTSARRRGTTLVDTRFLHITPGFLPDLIRFRPDLLVSNELGFRTLVAVAYGKLLGRPVFVWWGGTTHTERVRDPLRRWLRRMIAPHVDHWFSYGRSSTEYLRTLGVPLHAICEIQNCVSEERFQKEVPPAWTLTPRPVLLHVGQLIGRKGVGLLLESVARLQRSGREFSLLLVGEGPEGPRLRCRAAELGLRHVTFQPAAAPGDMPAVYRSADAFVFPTLEDVWGLVVNEALWSGLPVLASRYAGCCAELLPPEHRFDPLNASEFDEKVCALLDSRIGPSRCETLRPLKEVAQTMIDRLAVVLESGR
jgi:glycosyltransferase involved in cell wall biosynthesis